MARQTQNLGLFDIYKDYLSGKQNNKYKASSVARSHNMTSCLEAKVTEDISNTKPHSVFIDFENSPNAMKFANNSNYSTNSYRKYSFGRGKY